MSIAQIRNTFVALIQIRDKGSTNKQGIYIPAATKTEYRTCMVQAVGSGMTSTEDELSQVRDLQVGQIVLAKVRVADRNGGIASAPAGIPYKLNGQDVIIVEQHQIVMILAQPEDVQLLETPETEDKE